MMIKRLTSLFLVCLLALLPACAADKKGETVTGERVAVLEALRRPILDTKIEGFSIQLPAPAVYKDWPQVGGMTTHMLGPLALGQAPRRAWSTSVGRGSSGAYKLLAQPVVAQGVIYTMDARGKVTAFQTRDAKELWSQNTAPEGTGSNAMGGGIAYDKSVIYATTGFGEVLAMDARTGNIIWRRALGKPLRSAPTISDDRVFVISIENETFALDARTSLVMWQHRGIAESATLMGSSSPAVHGDTVVVAYSSGELFGLRAQNGRVVWSEVLALPRSLGALPAIADIRGLPVIDKGHVYAVSHSGRMVALAERTGERIWEAEIDSMNTPFVAGNVIYIVTLDRELVALDRETGRAVWSMALQAYEKPADRSSKPVLWWGPVLAGDRLWLTNSMGSLQAYDAISGGQRDSFEKIESAFSIAPIVVDQTLYVLSESGRLTAFK